jgi:hypothetical protein
MTRSGRFGQGLDVTGMGREIRPGQRLFEASSEKVAARRRTQSELIDGHCPRVIQI